MGEYFDHVKRLRTLEGAWRVIRSNGIASTLSETRQATEVFEQEHDLNLFRIQRLLNQGLFEFAHQVGVAKKKASGSGKRGIVMAAIRNRVVERAILDTLQSKSSFIKSVITLPTSVGGVPERSVPHGLKLIADFMASGYRYYVRSDISGFFDHVPRHKVIGQIAKDIEDPKFLDLLDRATTVTLANEKELGEDRHIFPTGDEGVAQGSPLSPLFGNVLLYDLDRLLNDRGVVCVRFIDDFVIMSREATRAQKAFENATLWLKQNNLSCHNPFLGHVSGKASEGAVDQGFVFLGYDIRPGLFQPSAKARSEVILRIKTRLRDARNEIIRSRKTPHSQNTLRYAQALVGVDRIVRGWGNSFAYGNSKSTMEQMDEDIEKLLNDFRSWQKKQLMSADWKARRRMGGVCLLGDIPEKSLNDVPFRVSPGDNNPRNSKQTIITTDGSVIGGNRNGKDRGPGGWAFVNHQSDERRAGNEENVTNNQMELRAVIEALKSVPDAKFVKIRTDSQYVFQVANGKSVAHKNSDLWKEYERQKTGRRVKIVWVKGHNDDPHNEVADKLAREASESIAAVKKTNLVTSSPPSHP